VKLGLQPTAAKTVQIGLLPVPPLEALGLLDVDGRFSLQAQTRTIPIVFVAVSDPVGAGVVASLARP